MSSKSSQKSAAAASSSQAKATDLKSKSPAEFFAEHQNIAGFDNAGKSLFTTVREFVENSLDVRPSHQRRSGLCYESLVLTEREKLEPAAFNALRGISAHERKDASLYQTERPHSAMKRKSAKLKETSEEKNPLEFSVHAAATSPSNAASDGKDVKQEKGIQYFRVTCRDNGGGMPHNEIPSMLGIVLSSTKYGVKQTRGKFGLGAKMALVWAKKSTGLPIHVRSATSANSSVSECVLDIDIHRNQPHIIKHDKLPNTEYWRGTAISVVIEGDWSRYKANVVRYCRQLAVITPYANITLQYIDSKSARASFTLQCNRRTTIMPLPPSEVKHHPSAVDNLRIESLVNQSSAKTLVQFLSKELSSINTVLAKRLINELGAPFTESMEIQSLSKDEIHRLTDLLKHAKFAPPSPDCLSPAGEYNLRLGVIKEFKPDLVSTHRDEPRVFEGHPFIVEAAISLGGTLNQHSGVTVVRYANRIPLLFEAGSDVVSVICNHEIKWSNYKIKPNLDRIGVFVSLVSTKIPFKGTSKEYIGDDRGVLHDSIKRCLSQCCLQLKKRLASRAEEKQKEERKKTLIKYIPDVSRALMAVLAQMRDNGPQCVRKRQRDEDDKEDEQPKALIIDPTAVTDDTVQQCQSLLQALSNHSLTQPVIESHLRTAVERADASIAMEFVVKQGRKTNVTDDCNIGCWPTRDDPKSIAPIYTRNLRVKLI